MIIVWMEKRRYLRIRVDMIKNILASGWDVDGRDIYWVENTGQEKQLREELEFCFRPTGMENDHIS